jgi:predicted transcriptional regulator
MTDKNYTFDRLESLGLTENDSRVYTHLLERGVAVAPSKIAGRLGLHRQYVHYSLQKLLDMGLVEEVPVGARTHYKALPPRYLTSLAKKQLENAESAARELEKISTLGDEQDFEVYKGTRQVFEFEESLVHSLPQGETQYIIGGGADAFINFFGDRYEEITHVAKEHGLKAKYVGSKEEVPWLERAKKANTGFEYKILNTLPKTRVQTAIRFNSVTFYSFGNPPLVYIVKSKTVYDDYKKFFDMLWNMAE